MNTRAVSHTPPPRRPARVSRRERFCGEKSDETVAAVVAVMTKGLERTHEATLEGATCGGFRETTRECLSFVSYNRIGRPFLAYFSRKSKKKYTFGSSLRHLVA
jgi:hypothetical protein